MTKHQGLDSVIQFFQKKLTNVPGSWEYNSALCNALITASGAEAASIWRLDSRRCLHIVYSTDIPRDQLPQFTLGPGEGISGAAALSCKTLIVSDARSHPHYDDRVDNHMSSRTRSLICAPIISDGFLYGVLNILNLRTAAPLPHEWSELLSLCATLYATVLSTDGQLLPFSSKPTAANHRSEEEQHVPSIVGISPSIQDALHLCLKAARSDVPVLIRGETGTGKELAAHRIHEASGRCKGPFLAVNCAALTETLLESELFGHVKGAFTGALRDRQGKFVAAEGGTLFLDEIGEMSTSSQARILRALEEHTVTPVGSEKSVPYHARIIAATNKDLFDEVRQARFREDLYYRLCGIEILMPPLRDRPDDICLLATHFLDKVSRTRYPDSSRTLCLSPEVATMLVSYSWPGNVRQLEQALYAAAALAESEDIQEQHFPRWFHEAHRADRNRPRLGSYQLGAPRLRLPSGFSDSAESLRSRFLEALSATRYPGTGRWNLTAASRLLEIPRKTLAYQLQKLGLRQG